jgi:hypothetical protein
MLSVVMLDVAIQSVIMLSVMAPITWYFKLKIDTQNNNTCHNVMLGVVLLNVIVSSAIMLIIVVLSIMTRSVVIQSVIMVNVVAPLKQLCHAAFSLRPEANVIKLFKAVTYE